MHLTVKVDANLLRTGGQLLDQFGEDQGSQERTEREGSKQEDLIFPNEMLPLLVSVVDQIMEVHVPEINRGGPVTWPDSGPNGQIEGI